MDKVSPEKRSWIMSRIRSVDTRPELFVRSVLHRAGYRYALHAKDLPGSPDVVMRSRGLVVEVRGCFWHAHRDCPTFRAPSSRVAWWEAKFRRNTERDARNEKALRAAGWRLLVVWECFLKHTSPEAREHQAEVLLARVERLLGGRRRFDALSERDFLRGWTCGKGRKPSRKAAPPTAVRYAAPEEEDVPLAAEDEGAAYR
jgi:DNA mismatch endonuclease (patch repair protein)